MISLLTCFSLLFREREYHLSVNLGWGTALHKISLGEAVMEVLGEAVMEVLGEAVMGMTGVVAVEVLAERLVWHRLCATMLLKCIKFTACCCAPP